MEALLIFAVVILTLSICIVAGLWYYRDQQARKQNAPPPGTVRRRAQHDPWAEAVRASRNKS
jgi:hypothetical protein